MTCISGADSLRCGRHMLRGLGNGAAHFQPARSGARYGESASTVGEAFSRRCDHGKCSSSVWRRADTIDPGDLASMLAGASHPLAVGWADSEGPVTGSVFCAFASLVRASRGGGGTGDVRRFDRGLPWRDPMRGGGGDGRRTFS